MTNTNSPRLMIVMGVSGSGKSTVASDLAAVLGAVYLDADDYHPAENIARMSRGEALQDEDRWPWLEHFAHTITGQKGVVVGACSALRKVYREHLSNTAGEVVLFVYLEGSKALIRERMLTRENHFMPDSLLDSQFATLEPPHADEFTITIDINRNRQQITEAIVLALRNKHHES